MRVIFPDAACSDNLPEIRKRQYENKSSVRASRRNCSITARHEKQKRALSFFRQAKYSAILTRRNIGKALELSG